MKYFVFILLFSLNNNPPGTVKIKDHFVDKTEIQNIHWLEYIYHRGQVLDSVEIQKLLPDSSNFWYLMPENQYKPIVLITYEQAVAYCEWRSTVVSDKIGRKIRYRLPTKAEWQNIAEEIVKSDLEEIEKEIKETKKMIKKDSGQHVLVQIQRPKSRVYNMFSNVSEMTLEKGIAMGSNNYELTNPNNNFTKLIKYSSANAYLGFRCVAEIE